VSRQPTGDGPIDAIFNDGASLELFQAHAVTTGADSDTLAGALARQLLGAEPAQHQARQDQARGEAGGVRG
jgi:hypothetical protein